MPHPYTNPIIASATKKNTVNGLAKIKDTKMIATKTIKLSRSPYLAPKDTIGNGNKNANVLLNVPWNCLSININTPIKATIIAPSVIFLTF